jgi:hypothetical protein
MEDDLKKMENDLKKMEHDLKKKKNALKKKENDLNEKGGGDGRQPKKVLKNGRQPQNIITMEDDLKHNLKINLYWL